MRRRIKTYGGKQTTIPIKSKKKIDDAINYFIKIKEHAKTKIKRDQAYRNYIFFLTGINTAFRGEDLLQLRVIEIINGYMKIKENKTGKMQNFRLNKTFHAILLDYINYFNLKDHDYMFVGQKTKQTYKGKEYNVIHPITKQNANYILGKMARAINLETGCSLHTLRKTFGYQFYASGGKLITLQKMYNHEDPSITLIYIMWDEDDIENVRSSIFVGKKL